MKNLDFGRFRGGVIRKVKDAKVHPKWRKNNDISIYYDVGLLILNEVSFLVIRKLNQQAEKLKSHEIKR